MTSPISAYASLCARATPESLRRNPVTAPYVRTFFKIAKSDGFPIARAWLLGALVFDSDPNLHAPENAPENAPSRHTSAQHPATRNHSSNRQLARLQQHIEAASADILHVATGAPSI